MAPDFLDFERMTTRITWIMWLLCALGVAVAFAIGGRPLGFGFLVGAVMGAAGFRWLKSFVAALGPGGKAGVYTLLFLLRYLIFGAVLYVILRYSKLSLPAVGAGVFIPLAAVIVELLIQAEYARRKLHR